MNGYFDRLGEELRLAAELRYGPGGTQEPAYANAAGRLSRTRRRVQRFAFGRVGRWPRLGVLAVVAVSGSAAAAAIPLLGGSDGLSGRVPQAALSSPGRIVGPLASVLPHRLPNGLRYAIPVTPDLEAGDAGWCSYPAFFLARSSQPLPGGGGACAPAPPARSASLRAASRSPTSSAASTPREQPAQEVRCLALRALSKRCARQRLSIGSWSATALR